jgi:hypothetical protein
MNLLSLVDPRLDNICQIKRKYQVEKTFDLNEALVCLVVGAGSQERSAAVSCVTCDNTRHDAGSRGSRVSPFGHFCARSGYARAFLNPDRANLDYASV